ncbi:hypothetical protein BDC45DRAFT_557795 [Circinella umbellata]|nr:hypothetical protein BDC45DRAFT_557795 [Circinella umbellata]
MQIKYATTIFSAVFLLLQVSTPMVDAFPTEPMGSSQGYGLRSTFNVNKRQTESPDQIIDKGLAEYATCVENGLSEVKCFDEVFDTVFVDSLTGDGADEEQKDFKSLVSDIIANNKECVKYSDPENIDTNCLVEFRKVLVEVVAANK